MSSGGGRQKSRAPCCYSKVIVIVVVVVVHLPSIKQSLLDKGRVVLDLLHVSLGLLLQGLRLLLELGSQLVHVDVRVSLDGLQPGDAGARKQGQPEARARPGAGRLAGFQPRPLTCA
jgi:hypothetical protein